uniref:HSF-type DNA-binding domain-containing protein n=1 Tax=Panagrolaimus superbus TaxID=310955 RepID=A0A914ZB34_9BILA
MSNTAQISSKSATSMPINTQQIPQQPELDGTLSAPPPQQQTILKEDDKMPLFLIKLWNIVEDPTYYDVIRWDESGYSFHILDPYSFCRNVLPQYFKHNNLNSLIRQLNMYGFRKMTPIERTSLARLESDQDHLEFSHPCFVRDHPELLTQIKRKTPTTRREDAAASAQPSKDLSNVLEEMRGLRERQKTMEDRMNELVTDNNAMWQQMTSMRAAHAKQQQIVNKLVQFLVTLVQPKRLPKRHLLAIDEFASPKRARTSETADNNGISSQSLQTIQQSNLNDILDHLMKEISKSNAELNLPSTRNGPIISDVTDELDHLSTTGVQMNQGNFISQRSNNSPIIGGYDPNAYGYQNQLQPQMIPVTQPQQQHQRPPSTTQQQVMPQVLSPNIMPDEPLILSPNADLGFNSTDFADYLNGVDHSIDSCRDLIGDHWNSFDFDNLLNSSDPSPPGDHGFPQQPLSLEHTHPQSVYSMYPSPTNISAAIPSQQQHQPVKAPQQMAFQQPQVLSSSPNRGYGNRRKH